jgi:hypothetical protein
MEAAQFALRFQTVAEVLSTQTGQNEQQYDLGTESCRPQTGMGVLLQHAGPGAL